VAIKIGTNAEQQGRKFQPRVREEETQISKTISVPPGRETKTEKEGVKVTPGEETIMTWEGMVNFIRKRRGKLESESAASQVVQRRGDEKAGSIN